MSLVFGTVKDLFSMIIKNTSLSILFSLLILSNVRLHAQNDLKLNFKNSIVYAGIEVGSKGVKMSVIEVNRKSKKGPVYQIVKDTAINSDFISFSSPTFYATLDAMQALFNKAVKQYDITTERIFTAVSSGVKGQADKESKTVWIQNLADSFKIRIAEPARNLNVIEIAEEARLSHLGIVPDDRRYSTFLIDVGSGNTKGGYFPYGNTTEFKLFQLNWGTKSTSNAAEKRSEDDNSVTNYQKQLNRVLSGAVDKEVIYAVNESGAYNMSDYVAVSGGIAWSVATLLYPELIDNAVVPVTYEEVEKLGENLYSKYPSLSADNLVKKLDSKNFDRIKISKEIKNVHQVFDQKSLMAGVGLLLKIMRQFKGVHEGKEFYLVKNGQVGWISAYVNQQTGK
jgi:hypothetical protein